jgi:glycerol transport system ATP-binding protein
VYGNIAYPLKNDKVPAQDIKKRVYEIAELLELTDVLGKSTEILTAADKQKVSLGRGLVRKDTAAVLLDEPLTVIDPKQQWNLRRKLRQAQDELKITMIYVTHDQHEALTFADYVTVMWNGEVVQYGTPSELHEEPATPFVGYFIGSPGMNLYSAERTDGMVKTADFTLKVSDDLRKRISEVGDTFTLGIRPEFVEVHTEKDERGIQTELITIEDTGAYKILTLKKGGTVIKTRAPETMDLREGDAIWAVFPEEKIKVFRKR